jgi:hypothetical protein
MELLVKGIEVFIVLLKDKLCLSKEIKKSQMALNFIYQRIEDSCIQLLIAAKRDHCLGNSIK